VKGEKKMPFITIKVLEGRSEQEKRAIVEKMTMLICEEWNTTPDKVFIFIEDMAKTDYGKNGKLFKDL
jgi:4-oxalocrotonate tautomerase